MPKTVACGAPLIITVEFETKPVPATVTAVGVVVPAPAAAGLKEMRPGTGFVTDKFMVLEVPPLGGGLITTICTVPAVAISAGEIEVSSEVGVPDAARRLPFTETSDCETKLLPLIVSVKPLLPVATPEGEIEVICGSGLGAAVISNVAARVFPPPGEGVETTTDAEHKPPSS